MFATYPNSSLRSSYYLAPSKIPINKPYTSPSGIKFHQPKIVAYSTATKQTKRPQHSRTDMASTTSLYEVLGIPMSASGHEIKAAYRRLARMCHPDVVSINQKEMSANEFMKIHTAYSTLSDPDKRASYDRDLFRRTRPYGSSLSSATMAAASSSMSRFSGYNSRNWETDQCW